MNHLIFAPCYAQSFSRSGCCELLSNRPASSSQPLSFLNRIPPSALTIIMSSQQQIDPKKQQGMSYIGKQALKYPQILTLGPHNRAAVSVYEFQEHPPTTSAEDWWYRARSWGAQVSLSFSSKGGIGLQSLGKWPSLSSAQTTIWCRRSSWQASTLSID